MSNNSNNKRPLEGALKGDELPARPPRRRRLDFQPEDQKEAEVEEHEQVSVSPEPLLPSPSPDPSPVDSEQLHALIEQAHTVISQAVQATADANHATSQYTNVENALRLEQKHLIDARNNQFIQGSERIVQTMVDLADRLNQAHAAVPPPAPTIPAHLVSANNNNNHRQGSSAPLPLPVPPPSDLVAFPSNTMEHRVIHRFLECLYQCMDRGWLRVEHVFDVQLFDQEIKLCPDEHSPRFSQRVVIDNLRSGVQYFVQRVLVAINTRRRCVSRHPMQLMHILRNQDLLTAFLSLVQSMAHDARVNYGYEFSSLPTIRTTEQTNDAILQRFADISSLCYQCVDMDSRDDRVFCYTSFDWPAGALVDEEERSLILFLLQLRDATEVKFADEEFLKNWDTNKYKKDPYGLVIGGMLQQCVQKAFVFIGRTVANKAMVDPEKRALLVDLCATMHAITRQELKRTDARVAVCFRLQSQLNALAKQIES